MLTSFLENMGAGRHVLLEKERATSTMATNALYVLGKGSDVRHLVQPSGTQSCAYLYTIICVLAYFQY